MWNTIIESDQNRPQISVLPKPKYSGILRLYQFSQTAVNRFQLLSVACLNGFWLGIFNQRNLDKIDEIYYRDTKVYYSPEYNAKGLKNWESVQIEKYFSSCQQILVLAAGGGREVFDLQNRGFKVDAFECHEELLAFANSFLKENGLIPCVKHIARSECPTTDKTYDGAIIGWGAYTLIRTKQERLKLLKKLSQQLSPGAPILLSFMVAADNRKVYKIVASIANIFRFLLNRERVDNGDFLAPNFVHFFNREQIETELTETGFKIEFFSEKPYGHAVAFRQPSKGR